jgi:predicted nucleic acid-binding protein
VRTVSVDSDTLILATKEIPADAECSERDRELIRRARILSHSLDVEGATVVVPAVVLSEYLAGVLPEHHEAVVRTFQGRFEVPPFDLKAAALSAKLWQIHRGLPRADQIERVVLKVDVMVIATAKAFGASTFYTNDAKGRKLAEQAGLIALPLPESRPYILPEVVTPKRAKRSRRDKPPGP